MSNATDRELVVETGEQLVVHVGGMTLRVMCSETQVALALNHDDKSTFLLNQSWLKDGKPCPANIWHGPGHQSRTPCEVTGEHEVHEARFGSDDQLARWRGDKVFSGYFDEAPRIDE